MADIARPVVSGKRPDFPFAEQELNGKSPCCDIVPNGCGDVGEVFPVAERRDHDGEGVQPEEQVLAEVPAVDFVLQVAVCGAYKPEVDRFVLRGAEREHGMFLQDA